MYIDPYKTSNKRGILTVSQAVYLGKLKMKLFYIKFKQLFNKYL